MRNQNELLAMSAHARTMALNARDRGLLGKGGTTQDYSYAEGVEAALLWALGHIRKIPDFTLRLAPADAEPLSAEELDNLPGLSCGRP